MNTYKIRMKKDGHTYFAFLDGETLDLAIEHANYWYEDGEKIGTDYTDIEVMDIRTCFCDPYTYENAVRKALAHPMKSIHAILQRDSVSDSDKLDLIKRITNGTPSGFQFMDTAERDDLIDIMKGMD